MMQADEPPAAQPVDPDSQAQVSSSGLVIPHTLNLPKRLLAGFVYALIRIVGATLRLKWEIHPEVIRLNQRAIYAIWHNRLPLSLLMYRGVNRRLTLPPQLAAIVSASKDGAVVARVLEHFGVQPVRGSSSRRGPQALLELTSCAEKGCDIAITPDGPRGPRYVTQPGVISLSQLTGLPIIPAANYVKWKICLKSWDGFQIPLPFSHAVYKFGEPLVVPREASDGERENLRQELQKRMLALTVD